MVDFEMAVVTTYPAYDGRSRSARVSSDVTSSTGARQIGNDIKPRGYLREIVLDQIEVIPFICGSCDVILKEPVQVHVCGHRFCELCYCHMLSVENMTTCPTCLRDDTEDDAQSISSDTYNADFACKRAMKKWFVRCEYHAIGCDFEGEFQQFEEHVKECEYRIEQCECGKNMMKRDLARHLQFTCEHALEIPSVQTPEDHNKAFVVVHASKLREDLLKAKYTISKDVQALNKKVTDLESKKQSRENKSEAVYKKDAEGAVVAGKVDADFVEETRHTLRVLEDKRKATDTMFGALYKEVQRVADGLMKMDRKLTLSIESRDAQLEEMKASLARGPISYNGTLLWAIDDVKLRFEQAQNPAQASLLSQPFYTSKTGYKLCGRIYLNGDGIGRNQFLSIFLVVMKGQHDGMLKWPFHQFVTFTLIDQSGNGQHVRDSFRADPASSSFRRPRTEMNVASGCPRFMKLADFTHKMSHFINDENEMLIEIKVDTTGLENFGGQGI